jgi:AcrR family transcriptional regulator
MAGYDSPLRAEQQEQTRVRILEAVATELEHGAVEELSFASIAARARVAERTVYRHFPTRENLMDAFWQWWIAGPFGVAPDVPVSHDELPALIARIYNAFDAHEQVSRAFVFSRTGREIRNRSRASRLKMIATTVDPVVRRLSPEERRLALAVFQMIYSINTWQTLRDLCKLSGEETTTAAAWLARLLIRELRSNPRTFKEGR